MLGVNEILDESKMNCIKLWVARVYVMCYETDCMNFTAMYDCRESLDEGMEKKISKEVNSCI